jgi:hypothetical protein
MRGSIVLCVLVACKTKPAPVTIEGGVTSVASVASVVVDAGPPPKPKPLTARQVVDRWNEAHVKHDTRALEGLYAFSVQFYGQTLSNKACAAKKGAAFAKSPDYTQSIKDLQIAQTGTATTITFTKTSTEKGKSTDYPAVLVVSSGVITAETDKITEANLAAVAAAASSWCLDSTWWPNDTVRPPYKISALTAYMFARRTKYLARQEAAHPKDFIDFDSVGCPTKCDQAARECGYTMRLSNHSDNDPEVHFTNVIDWVYVDAVSSTLWYEDAGGWKSEPLVITHL